MMNNDTRIIDLTVAELRQLVAEEVVENLPAQTPPATWREGLRGIARVFGCSQATAQKIKDSGIIDAAVVQVGRKIKVNEELALELALKSNNKLSQL